MITILIVEDHTLIRTAITQLLESVGGFKIIGDASTGEEGVHLAKKLMPDVVLMDIQLPGIDGLDATNKMIRQNPDIKILIVSMYTDEPYPSLLLQAGAVGYVTKGCTADEMIRAIRMVHSGQGYLSSGIAEQLALKRSRKAGESEVDRLSERELQVALMIVNGNNIREISEKLCVSPKTVNGHRCRILSKLSMTSDVALTLWAIRGGLIQGQGMITVSQATS